MKRVLVTERIHPDGLAILAEAGIEVIEGWTLGADGLQEALPGVNAVLTRIARVPAEMMAAAPELKIVAKHGVGCDNIDLAEARARGITVAIAADGNASSVAEHTMMFILGLAKNLGAMNGIVRGNYGDRLGHRVVDVAGRRILVLGYGRIGRLVAPLCATFGMKVVLHDLLLEGITEQDGFEVAPDLESGLEGADFLTVHVPLTGGNAGLIGRVEMLRLNPGAFVINCARGGIVDERALADLVAEGYLGGAASDVYSDEPILPGNPILELDGALLTPHSAALSDEAARRSGVRAASNIRDFFEGRLAPEMVFQAG